MTLTSGRFAVQRAVAYPGTVRYHGRGALIHLTAARPTLSPSWIVRDARRVLPCCPYRIAQTMAHLADPHAGIAPSPGAVPQYAAPQSAPRSNLFALISFLS